MQEGDLIRVGNAWVAPEDISVLWEYGLDRGLWKFGVITTTGLKLYQSYLSEEDCKTHYERVKASWLKARKV